MINAHDSSEINFFAETNFRNRNVKFGIKTDDRRRHMYVIGKTGMGKTTLLENMVIEDIRAGRGLALTDPHGDLAEKILNYVPGNRIKDVVYFNPTDAEFPIAFNILENTKPEYKNLIASGLVGVFKKIWADSWGPRLEYILMNAILALLENPGNTLLSLPRLLVDKKFRKVIVDNVQDPVVKSFWVDEYANYNEKFRNEAIAPIQNKIGQFLASSIIRNIVAQSKSTIEIRQLMDEGKVIIMNLAKGRIGEENAALLGAMMITKIQLAAMSRVDTEENKRRDFYLYVDEFQNFATDSFANILSEARKYRLSLVVAHQYMEQLGDVVKAAVLGNVGTMVLFRIGATDAEELEKEFDPFFMMNDMVNLPKYHIYIKLMIDGITSDPFSARSLPPLEGRTDNAEKIIKFSREQYGRPREQVEDEIKQWAGLTDMRLSEENDGKKIMPSKIRPSDNLVLQGIPLNARKVEEEKHSPAKQQTPPPTPAIIQAPRNPMVNREDQELKNLQFRQSKGINFVNNTVVNPFQRQSQPQAPTTSKEQEEKQDAQLGRIHIPTKSKQQESMQQIQQSVRSRTQQTQPTPQPRTQQERMVTEEEVKQPVAQKEEDGSIKLQKVEKFVDTGPEVSLKAALQNPIMGFKGRPVRQQMRNNRGERMRT